MIEKEIVGKNLRHFFEEIGNKKVVILPLRTLSEMVSDILKAEYDIQEQFIVDNHVYDMEHIYPMDRMPEGYQDCHFLIAAFGSTKRALEEQLLKYVSEDKIVDLLFDEEREQVFNSDSKVHLDFLCAGFAKCGTTSLHYALAQNPNVFVPQVKETFFLRNPINKNAHEAYKNHYKAADTAGKLVGDIEPSYRSCAEEVYRYCGSDLKVIFCVRNPLEALYSDFKMEMRNEPFMLNSNSTDMGYDRWGSRIGPEMFDKWAEQYRFRENYAEYIKAFTKYYPPKQIKIVVGEELFANANGIMSEMQNFLGIAEEDRVEYREFPRENIGSKVAKDSLGLDINRSIKQLRHKLIGKSDFQSLELLDNIGKKIEKLTLVDYNEPMLESTRRDLLDYYMDSIHDLEGMLGRSLQGLWY